MADDARWGGLPRELALLGQAWRDLPDNPLWTALLRQRAHVPAQARRRRRENLMLLGGVGVPVYAGLVWLFLYAAGSPSRDRISAAIALFLVLPAAGVAVYCITRLARRAQSWLAPASSSSKRPAAARLDQLLTLTRLSPRDVVVAAVRELLPLLAGSAALGAGLSLAGFLLLRWLDKGSHNVEFLTVVQDAPLTLLSLFALGLLGGLALALLCFCLGLNGASAVQQTGLSLVLAIHQTLALPASLASLLGVDLSGEHAPLWPIAAAAGALAAALLLGSALALRHRRPRPGWLAVPAGLLLAACYIAFAAMLVLTFRNFLQDPLSAYKVLVATACQVIALGSALSLCAPACVPLKGCFGEIGLNGTGPFWVLPVNYALCVVICGLALALAYRAALACAAERLRAGE